MSTTETDRVDAAVQRLRDAGLRRTRARLGVLHELAQAVGGQGHLTVTQLHHALLARGLAVELSTVHRLLRQLVEVGVAHTVPTGRTLTFGLADIAHHHAICAGCGDLRQLPAEAVAASVAAARAVGIEADPSGHPTGVVVYGQCAGCRTMAR
ncbi:transcriptional repressor [Micromonospora sp. Llam7]|uniref:Fur family transcriptional regulator n=1 Tax=Micromonospora tarapacensis TaxID=2835305 RepID=UPI001C83ADB1|nr:transcriptional repressor [Micromonospora tarapacensis]MBX7270061.1 transcriptional repressor [Micromonospora tarapacensis]